jgi:DNA/RNA-binding domain of Phe-tRNA-synthetase-like protein
LHWIIRNQLTDRVRPTWFALQGVTVRSTSDALQQELLARGGELMARYPDPAGALPAFSPARRMYHACGLDPSKVRPSSEALVRRILLGKGLFRVNTAVDAANLASISFLRPVGLYDTDKIDTIDASGTNGRPDPGVSVITLRLGTATEEYPGIGKETIHVAGRPTLFDRLGPFGNPSADSARTRITETTTRLLFVIFEPVDEPTDGLEKHLALALATLQRHLGGKVEDWCPTGSRRRSSGT